MTLLKAIIMGIFQGIAEFLPISSAHFIILENCFHIKTDTGVLFDILLHFGTLSAIIFFYFHDIKKLVTEFIRILGDCFVNLSIFFENIVQKENKEYRRIINKSYRKFVMLIIVSSIPAAIVGYTARGLAEVSTELLIFPGILLFINGGILLFTDNNKDGTKTPKYVTYTNSFMIGIVQGIATIPGLSRSGGGIAACLFSKFDRRFAIKYTFILSIPAILGGCFLRIRDINTSELFSMDLLYAVIGTVFSAVVGYICIKVMTEIVLNKKNKFFAIYSFLAGFLAIGGYFYMK